MRNIKEKTVRSKFRKHEYSTIVYETSDGREFNTRLYAEAHDDDLRYQTFEKATTNLFGNVITWLLAENKDDLDFLVNHISKKGDLVSGIEDLHPGSFFAFSITGDDGLDINFMTWEKFKEAIVETEKELDKNSGWLQGL